MDEDIKDKFTKVCICKNISKATIKAAIKNGAITVEEVQRVTGAGKGICNGKKCDYKIQDLLDELLNGSI